MTSRISPRRLVILAHGGAGDKGLTSARAACIRLALITGFELLRREASALDAVEATIRIMESSGLFNAGVGARLQLDGARRMDAALMEGLGLRAGAVAGIEGIIHPISAARVVMDKTSHVLIAGEPATRLAKYFQLDPQRKPRRATRATAPTRIAKSGTQRRTLGIYREMARRETVGAVALDLYGNLAAGASTGGIALMLPGRVGDTPLIGCGVYADNQAGAVSMTGVGESIIRLAMAKDIVDRMAVGASPSAAACGAIDTLRRRIDPRPDTAVGALVLAPNGRFAIRHSSRRMAAGYWTGRNEPVVADRFS